MRHRRVRRRLHAAGRQLRTSRWTQSDWQPLPSPHLDIVGSCHVTLVHVSWRSWHVVWLIVLRCRHLTANRQWPHQPPPSQTRQLSPHDVTTNASVDTAAVWQCRCNHCDKYIIVIWTTMTWSIDYLKRGYMHDIYRNGWRSRSGLQPLTFLVCEN